MLNLPASEQYPSLPIPPEQQRRRLLAMLVEWVVGAACTQPLTIALEDLHWADASTLEVVQLLAEQGPTAPLLLLCTARPEFRPQWPLRAHHTQITLNQLSTRNVREMIAQVAARDVLASETVDTVIERTGGVPLFVEELTRAVLESGGAKLAGREIPVTLHDSLMARLDRLGPAKEIIQIGSVIGGDFSYELLHAVHPVGAEELQAALRSATDAELVFVRGIAPKATYQFKHALIRDTAYEALLRSRRKELHVRIAAVLMRQFPESVTSAPELVAHHYTEAGVIEQAIPHWQRAGQRAAERSANIEAISHFTRGLKLLKSSPDSPKLIQQELGLQMALGGSLMALNGYGAPDAGQAYARALELCRQLGEPPQLFSVMFGLATFNMMRGELGTTQELAERLLRLGESVRKPALLESAHHMMGEVLFQLGELPQSRIHLEQAIVLNNPNKHSSFFYPRVAYLGIVAIALWLLGYADQALRSIRESLILAQEVDHPYSLANALGMAGSLYQLRREVEATKEQAEALIALSHEHGFVLWEVVGVPLRGWALAKQGRQEEGITLNVGVSPPPRPQELSHSSRAFLCSLPRRARKQDNLKKGSRH